MASGGSRERLRVVLDASVVAKWIIPGEPWEKEAARLCDRVAEGLVEAHVPSLLLYEVSSVILRAIRIGAIDEGDAMEAFALLKYLLNVHSVGWQSLPDIVKLSRATGLTVYDSTYLYLATSIGATLVTADEELATKGRSFARILHVSNLASLSGYL